MRPPDRPTARIRSGQTARPPSGPPPFGRLGAATGVLLAAGLLGGLVWSAVSGRPAAAQHPSLFAGSLVLEDTRPLPVVDVATAQITVRLEGVNAQVGAPNDGDVQPVPVAGGTVLVNRVTGSFNFLEADDYVTDPSGPGVGLGPLAGSTAAEGLASGPDAYVVRAGPQGTVSLVGQQTVAAAARALAAHAPGPAVAPLGFEALHGAITVAPGSAVVAGSDLWVLVGRPSGCGVVQLHPAATSRQGLVRFDRASPGVACALGALESDGPDVGLAVPGRVTVVGAGVPDARTGQPLTVPTPFTAGATRFLPVTGTSGRLWYLADEPLGWELFGVGTLGRVEGPFLLTGLGRAADPVPPAFSSGFLYTLDQQAAGQPELWMVDAATGR